jgi:hypothetical protein
LCRRLCAAPPFPAYAGEITGKRIVELWKVTPNAAHVDAFKIDSFGARSRRNLIAVSMRREGSGASFAQRLASSACVLT